MRIGERRRWGFGRKSMSEIKKKNRRAWIKVEEIKEVKEQDL
jgi:hypothetical protein